VMQHVDGVIRSIEPHDSPERMRALGVEVIEGEAAFSSPRTVRVGERSLSARRFVVATGSRPVTPSIPGLANAPFLTNETIFALREPVERLLVIGGGPVGCELAQAFARLGSEVTLIDQAKHLLTHEDPDLSAVVRGRMEHDGVRVHLGQPILRVGPASEGGNHVRLEIGVNGAGPAVLEGTHLVVAAGRSPAVDRLGLHHAGVEIRDGRITLDRYLRTSNPLIYVCGDAAGGLQFTHVAEHHARVVLQHALLHLPWAKPSAVIPWCTFTDPELARVGMSETEAVAGQRRHRIYGAAFADVDRAHTDGDTVGFAKVVATPRGRILGAAIVGPRAGDLIQEYVLAMAHGLRVQHLAALVHPYPTFVEINRRVADERLLRSLTPFKRRLLQAVFGLRGKGPPARSHGDEGTAPPSSR
jgi:pyruvate/2-oxoglutarate dehydrogenase complex dihydrolipoamide dehydrogenase (E3) component